MKIEEKLVLELCKGEGNSFLITGLINNPGFNWDLFLRLISRHMIAGTVLDKLGNFPLPDAQSDRINSLFIDSAIKINHNNKMFLKELKNITELLNRHNIDFILMKGLSINNDRMRIIRDIDILIREEETIRAIEVLKEINYSYVGASINPLIKSKERERLDLQFSWNNQYQLRHAKTGVLLEIHTNLFQRGRAYYEDLTSLLDNIELFREKKLFNKRLNCYTFSREHSLLLLCMYNAIKHAPSGNEFLLRSLVDIDRMVCQKIEWEEVTNTAVEMRIVPYVYFSLSAAFSLIGSNIPENILNDLRGYLKKKELFMTELHMQCISILSSPVIPSKLYQFFTPFILNKRWSDRLKWLLLFPILFPARWKMAKHFNLPRTSLLIPFTYFLNPFRVLLIALKIVRNK